MSGAREDAVAERTGMSRRDMRRLRRLAEKQRERLRGGRFWRQLDFFVSLAFLAVLALGIRAFLAEPIRVDGNSMYDTLHNNERLFVSVIDVRLSGVERGDEAGYAELVCFFELACAISGYMSGVNPFDQPGVEAYKKNMFKMLGKPGA